MACGQTGRLVGLWCLCLVVHVLFVLLVTGELVKDVAHSGSSVQSGYRSERLTTGDYSCGEGYCRCTDIYADCSHHFGKMPYVPQLPGTIQNLYLSYNGIRFIDKDFFQNVTNITKLRLDHNNITRIHPEAFHQLQRLQFLYLSGNKDLQYESVTPIFSITTLRELYLDETGLGPFPDHLVPANTSSQLEELYLIGNRISMLNLTTLKPLISLNYLQASSNAMTSIVADHFPQLGVLILTENNLEDFPETCRQNISLFPRLYLLELSGNRLENIPGKICLPELHILYLESNKFWKIEPYAFNTQHFPLLYKLYLSQMFIYDGIGKNAFNSKLEILQLDYHGIDFSDVRKVDADSFAGCENLRTLSLMTLLRTSMSGKRLQRLFGNLTKLTDFCIEGIGLSGLSSETFANFRSLRSLNLRACTIAIIPDGALDALASLKNLMLDDNRIFLIGPKTFGENIREKLTSLTMWRNPFLCSCDLMWFRQWLITDPSLFDTVYGDYMCANIPDMTVQSFYMPDQACLLSRETSISISTVTAMLISLLTLVIMLYRYRWHVRLVLYEAFRGRRPGDRWRRLQEGHFLYDIFVSYDSDDLHWVRANLIPELEERLRLKLCLHERDFIPGNQIVDNIATCVEASKKVMMLFSTNFASSEWCQFELNYCLRHVMDYDDALLVVMLHDIPPRDLTVAMSAVMKTTTYIEWDDTAESRASFWGRVEIALRKSSLPQADLVVED